LKIQDNLKTVRHVQRQELIQAVALVTITAHREQHLRKMRFAIEIVAKTVQDPMLQLKDQPIETQEVITEIPGLRKVKLHPKGAVLKTQEMLDLQEIK
jgi:hypothetical protein